MSELIDIAQIRTDGGTQPRAAIFEELVVDYAEAYARGDALPPPVVFFDGADYWLADGFHRYHAAKSGGAVWMDADVRQGMRRDAVLFSVGANATHGRPRTNEDKRRAVLTLLNDPEWGNWSDREIARQCRVSPTLPGTLRPAVTVHVDSEPEQLRTYTTRHGTPAVMNTAAIGQRPTAADRPAPASPPPMTAEGAGPARETAFAAARADMDENGPIFDAVDAIKAAFYRLPDAEQTARRFPAPLRHTFSAAQARHIGGWFLELADAWAAQHGDANAIAAE